MQASHMPPSNILSDHVSIGGKSQLHQRTGNAQDLLGEVVATRSHHTEEQLPLRVTGGINKFNEQEFQIESQQAADKKMQQMIEEPVHIYQQHPEAP